MMSVVLRLLLTCLVLSIMGCGGDEPLDSNLKNVTDQTVASGGESKNNDDDPKPAGGESDNNDDDPTPSEGESKNNDDDPTPSGGESDNNDDDPTPSGEDDQNFSGESDGNSSADAEDTNLWGKLKTIIPEWSNPNTQWIVAGLIILAGFFAQLISKSILARFLLLGNRGEHLEKKLSKAVGLTAAGLVWHFGLKTLPIDSGLFEIPLYGSKVFLIFAATLAGFRSIDVLGFWAAKKAGRTDSTLDDILVPLGRKALKLLVVAVGIVNLATILELQITPLLGALGVGSIGFAFAAQNTIENLFGSVTVVLDRPFSVGDWVEVDGVDGTVEEVGLRSTKVRTFYDSLVSIPNAKLTTAIVDNYGSRKYRRFKATLGVRYETTPEQIEAFCKGIKTLVADRSDTRKDVCYAELNGFGESSLNIMLYMFFECKDWTAELRGRHELMLDIIRLAHELGVEFAFPTQIVHLAEQALPMARPESFGAVNTSEAAGQLGEAKAKEIGGRGA